MDENDNGSDFQACCSLQDDPLSDFCNRIMLGATKRLQAEKRHAQMRKKWEVMTGENSDPEVEELPVSISDTEAEGSEDSTAGDHAVSGKLVMRQKLVQWKNLKMLQEERYRRELCIAHLQKLIATERMKQNLRTPPKNAKVNSWSSSSGPNKQLVMPSYGKQRLPGFRLQVPAAKSLPSCLKHSSRDERGVTKDPQIFPVTDEEEDEETTNHELREEDPSEQQGRKLQLEFERQERARESQERMRRYKEQRQRQAEARNQHQQNKQQQ